MNIVALEVGMEEGLFFYSDASDSGSVFVFASKVQVYFITNIIYGSVLMYAWWVGSSIFLSLVLSL